MTPPQSSYDASTMFGQAVKNAREARGMSQSVLLRLLERRGGEGFHQTTLSRIESGERAARIGEAVLLAAALQVPLEDLLSGKYLAPDRLAVQQQVGEVDSAFNDFNYAYHELAKARRNLRKLNVGEHEDSDLISRKLEETDPSTYIAEKVGRRA